MRVAGDQALAVVDPHLAPANAVERRRGCVPELKGLFEREILLLAIPIEEARIDAYNHAARGREHRRPGRGGEIDPLVDAAAIVARRAGEKLEIRRDVSPLDR